ncbi:MAG: pantetheine-phosphate adenylyltransferase [Dehalococcoidia bacterium]|jgi:pantetheine-phosphate adenylyltransferase|nr:pantetheine-phosphate adenylyltransferase [Dehalococcoidia bacterium]HJN58598.1 pantetheine-phosphate adenylyltransferase [Dehalococcoidia bacterium]
MVKAIFPGTFDPITNGHFDIILRGSKIFDEITIGVYRDSKKNLMFDTDERTKLIEDVIKDLSNVKILQYTGLTVNFAKKVGASVIIRGLRIGNDFEYEREMALMNRQINPDIELVCLISSINNQFISSSRIKEICMLQGDVSTLVSKSVLEAINKKLKDIKNN